jgi:hypothetical protein
MAPQQRGASEPTTTPLQATLWKRSCEPTRRLAALASARSAPEPLYAQNRAETVFTNEGGTT